MMNAVDLIRKSVSELIEHFQKYPFDFLYEADIQAALSAKANVNFGSLRIPLQGGYCPVHYPRGEVLSTTLVKCEYPGSRRFDVAFIDGTRRQVPFNAEEWKANSWKSDRFWELPVCAAVELKFTQITDRPDSRISGVEKDILKLKEYRSTSPGFLGISMLFIHSDALYESTPRSGLHPIDGIEGLERGIYGVMVSPSNIFWYKPV